MAYQVLARKWRPKSFSSLKGQEHVTRALINSIARGELHHAYLFTGTRGVGKTTLARILAKCFNCEQGVVPEPCGQCSACVNIDAGRFVDLIEVDAASRTRVEDTRELLDNVQYAPSVGRFKIYLIDEVHMLSSHSFNALLKTLEEPPPHVKFILATTDPERIPVTVLSRCLRFVLRPLSIADIVTQLEVILSSEKIPYEQRALHALARAATGSMRDALSLLEQACAFCDGFLKTEAVEEILGITYQRYLPQLLAAVVAKEVKQSLQVVEEMAAVGADFEQILGSILQVLHAIAIAQAVPQSEGIACIADCPAEELLTFKEKLTEEEVQLLYQIGLMGQKDLRYAPDLRTGFEMILLRMIVFRPVDIQATSVPGSNMPPKAIEPVKAEISVPLPAITVVQPTIATAKETSTLNWPEVITKLSLSGLGLMLVKNCVVSKWDGKVLVLTLDSLQKACLNPQRQMQIQEVLTQYFGHPIKLTINVGDAHASPLKIEQEQAKQRQSQAKASIEEDKTVQNILSTFDATVEKITVIDQ